MGAVMDERMTANQANWNDRTGIHVALVAPGGRFYIHDVHPFAWATAEDSWAIEYSYFEEEEPVVEDSEQSYTDAVRPLTHTRSYEWNHSIGEIVTALVTHGSRIEWLVEHDWTPGRAGRGWFVTTRGSGLRRRACRVHR
jgi:hypothetical protein